MTEFRGLGMDRRIPRRDFLNGMRPGRRRGLGDAVGLADGRRDAQAPAGEAALPTQRLGLRGQHTSSIESFAAIHRGDFAAAPTRRSTSTPSETYDLVIVGGGLSGLAAAYFWHKALPNQRVLILDNHDDFGGHAKRNEFVDGAAPILAYGGTMSVATPNTYSYMAKQRPVDLGVDCRATPSSRAARCSRRLSPLGDLLDKEHFGEDRRVAGTGRPSRPSSSPRRR